MRVVMNKQGQVTIPEELRKALGDEGCVEFEASVDHESRELTLHHVASISEDYAWAYCPENYPSMKRGLEDALAGRVHVLSEEDAEPSPRIRARRGRPETHNRL